MFLNYWGRKRALAFLSCRRNNMSKQSCHHGRVRRTGFTIVECLLGLAISAVLLTAVAVAFNASIMNYRENEQMYQTINSARQALTRMTNEIRAAGYLPDPDDPLSQLSVPMGQPANQCQVWRPNGESITFEFRSTDQKLYLVTNGSRYVLCDNVTAATFNPIGDGGGGMDAKSVEISLTVRCGDFQRTLCAAATIRRNLAP